MWFEQPFFEKKGADQCKFRCSSFPGGDLCDIHGKTVSLHVRLSEQSHSTFALVVSIEIYVRLGVTKRNSEFLWFQPPVFVKKGDDP